MSQDEGKICWVDITDQEHKLVELGIDPKKSVN